MWVNFSHIYKEGNGIAYFLANLALNSHTIDFRVGEQNLKMLKDLVRKAGIPNVICK